MGRQVIISRWRSSVYLLKIIQIQELFLFWICLFYPFDRPWSKIPIRAVESIWKHLPSSTAINLKSSRVTVRLQTGTINDATEPQRPHSTIKRAVLKGQPIMMYATETWAKGLWLTGICGNDFDRPNNHVSRLAVGGYGGGRWGPG